jgi:hypothetical protein
LDGRRKKIEFERAGSAIPGALWKFEQKRTKITELRPSKPVLAAQKPPEFELTRETEF